MPPVKTFHLRAHPGLVHLLQVKLNVSKRILEDEIVIKLFLLFRIDGVIHRTHIERGHIRLQFRDVGDALVAGDTDGAGGIVDDDIGAAQPHLFSDAAVGVHIIGGEAVVLAGMNVQDAGPGLDGAATFLGDLSGGVWDGRGLLSGGNGPGKGSGDDDFVHGSDNYEW